MKVQSKFKVLGTGSYLPKTAVSAEEMAKRMGISKKWIDLKTGVQTRYFAEEETIAMMAAEAVKNAMVKTSLKYEDIDLIIAAGGTPDQPIPHNSALIHRELNLPANITPMDINATCMSFIQALSVASSFLNSGIYQNIIIVSSEKPSIGLDYDWPESAALLGDGAVAFVLGQTNEDQGLLFSEFHTINSGVHLAEIQAGGTRIHPKTLERTDQKEFLFKMQGQQIYKLASKHLPHFFESTMQKNKCTFDHFKMVVPHQASLMGLQLMRKKLKIPEEKFYINVERFGNLVAASVPMAIHELIENESLLQGDDALLACTAAGLTLGCMGIRL